MKKLAALALGALAAVGSGGVAGAAAQSVVAGETITVDGGEMFTVTASCSERYTEIEVVTFSFNGVSTPVTCETDFPGDVFDEVGPAGLRMPAGKQQTQWEGNATASFTAPIAPDTYTGTIAHNWVLKSPPSPDDAVGMRRPMGFRAAPSVFVEQALPTFTVIVRQVPTTSTPTTTTTTTTTLAPTTTAAATTTVAATTTAAAAIPPAPTTTTAAAILPATGSDENNQALIAVGLVMLGGALIVATRYRRGSSAS